MTDQHTTVPFGDRIAALVAKEGSLGKRDPERMAAAVEALVGSLVLMIAIATRGDPEGMNTMLEGATAYAFERASETGKLIESINR